MGRMYVSGLLISMLMTFGFSQTEPELGQIWHKSEQNPIFVNHGEPGTWNSGGFGSIPGGHAMWDGENYRIYIYGRGPAPDYRASIGLFTSPQLDSGWVEYASNPILELDPTSWDVNGVTAPYVMQDGDTYKMWYSAADINFDVHIGYAESADGYSWDRLGDPVLSPVSGSNWEGRWVARPSVHKENDSTYMMWYNATSEGTPWQIGYAQSDDGIIWERVQTDPVLSPESGWASGWNSLPKVMRTADGFTLWFTGSTAGVFVDPGKLGTAISTDGINWQRDKLFNPVIQVGETGSWDETALIIMDVFLDADVHKMLYYGIDSDWDYGSFGIATYNPTIVPSGDVSGTWTKAGSPIRVQGEITIPNGETLTIEAGTTVEFLGFDPLNVQGQILAEGMVEEPIRFMVDDTLEFHDNASSEGVWGGIRFDGTDSTNDSSLLKYCVIEYAKTFAGNAGGNNGETGGGILVDNFNKLRIEQCLIQYNRVIGDYEDTGAYGAGIAISHSANPEILNNIIQHNICRSLLDNNGSTGGGVMVAWNSSPLISGNTIRFNSATETGGGLGIWLSSYPWVTNNLIVDNVCLANDGTGGAGGGVSIGWDARPIFINNTIANNSAGWTGGGFYSNGGNAVFINTIIANNRDIVEPFEGHEIGTYNMRFYTLNFQHSCLEGGEAGIDWEPGDVGIVNFIESIADDPQLWANFELGPDSPCLGSGAASVTIGGTIYEAPPVDYDGDPRPQPEGSNPDMGALENVLSEPTSAVDDITGIPTGFRLHQNYPNPFNPTTTIRYELSQASVMSLTIFDILGQEVITLKDAVTPPGEYEVRWNGMDDVGNSVSTGVYFVRLEAGSFSQTIKMVYLR